MPLLLPRPQKIKAAPSSKPRTTRLLKKLRRLTRRNGLMLLAMTLGFMTGCANEKPAPPASRINPRYSADDLAAIDHDYDSCGPAAKKALRDWEVMTAQ